MRNYEAATFQPTVRPDWAGTLDYMSPEEQSKIFQAILMFPSIEVKDSAFWSKTVKPDLEIQYKKFIESCEKKSIGARNRWGKISIPYAEDKNTICNSEGMDVERERERELPRENTTRNKYNILNTTRTCAKDFVAPKDADEVFAFAQVSGIICQKEQAENFFDYYSGIGWQLPNDNRTPMNDWRPFFRKWLRTEQIKAIDKPKPQVRLTLKEARELRNQQEIQKMLNGER